MLGESYLIGIAGPSGAGKSFLAEWLGRALVAPVLSLDHYYRDLSHLSCEVRGQSNFDDPAALEHELLIFQIRELAEGRGVAVPIYDFAQHTRSGETRFLLPGGYVIVEGIFTLYFSELRRLLGTSVYVEADEALCLQRRVERDVQERGRTTESLLEQVRSTVLPMMRQYVIPTRSRADVVVSGENDVQQNVIHVLRHVQQCCKQAGNAPVVR
jgi:uridine kinase